MSTAVVQSTLQPVRRLPRDLVVGAALVVGAVATLAVLPANSQFPLVAVLFGLAVGSLVLVLRVAAWAIVPLLVVELSIKNYGFLDTGITLRLAVVVVGVLLTSALLVRGGLDLLKRNPGVRVLLPAAVFVILATSVDLPREPIDGVSQYLRYQVTQLIALVMAACLVRRERDLRVVLAAGFALTLASCVMAIWQSIDPNTAPYAFIPTGDGVDPLQRGHADPTLRAVGLSGTPVQLTNGTSVVLPLLFGVIAFGAWRASWARWALLGAAAIISMAVYLSYTRSAGVAVVIGLGVVAVFLPWQRRLLVWSVLVGAAMLYLVLEGTGVIGDRYYAGVSTDGSAAQHLALLQVGTAIALDNPIIGIGHTQFQDVSIGYSGVLSSDVRWNGQTALGILPPHNDFLLVWVSWGLPVLAAYLGIFFGAVSNCVDVARRSVNGLVRGAAVGTLAALAGYAVNSAFHNALDTSMLLWLCAGLSVALTQIRASAPMRVAHSGIRHRQQLARRRGYVGQSSLTRA